MPGSPPVPVVNKAQTCQHLFGARAAGTPQIRVFLVGDQDPAPGTYDNRLLLIDIGNVVKRVPEIVFPDGHLLTEGRTREQQKPLAMGIAIFGSPS